MAVAKKGRWEGTSVMVFVFSLATILNNELLTNSDRWCFFIILSTQYIDEITGFLNQVKKYFILHFKNFTHSHINHPSPYFSFSISSTLKNRRVFNFLHMLRAIVAAN